MPSDTHPIATADKTDIYLLAGVKTSPNFMEPLRIELLKRYREIGTDAAAHLLFPYGDWSRRLFRQVGEVRKDLFFRFGGPGRRDKAGAPTGGERAAAAIRETYRGGKLVLIGHSAGGVAAVHAAMLVHALDHPGPSLGCDAAKWPGPPVHIVQVGSPKCAVPEEYKHRVMYIYSASAKGRMTDPAARLGSWRAGVFPFGFAPLQAPGRIVAVPIAGKHDDYFRGYEPYVNQAGETNLELVSRLIWEFVQERAPG